MILSFPFFSVLFGLASGNCAIASGKAITPDAPALVDAARPVSEIRRDAATIQYFTPAPTPTRVQVREGDHSLAVLRGLMGRADADPWSGPGVRVVEGEPGERVFHRVRIEGLEPGRRYFYRVWAPGEEPTSQEARFGAGEGWRREYAFATLAPEGERTIVRHPVKVLVMPNVVNVASAAGADAPPPEAMGEDLRRLVLEEFEAAARFLYVNSGMRFWPDFRVVFDERWQRWGDEAEGVREELRGLPLCRSYDGVDYSPPGGGRFTIVDPSRPEEVISEPIAEDEPFPSQIEVAMPLRWNAGAGRWERYTSGGGTLGVDRVWRGVPGQSQFLGGSDIAWLATHEFHHQMESLGSISLAHREDDRVVYNHYWPRRRDTTANAASTTAGQSGRTPWSTSGRHGEHYDGMAYWDRSLTDAQWLRMLLGEVVTVRDADGDGFPDDDPRLPLDEKRFGSSPGTPATDGAMNDFEKAMLSTWAPAPLQASALKPAQTFVRPDPRRADSDGDGLPDGADPAPLVPAEPFVWPLTAAIDGGAAEWAAIPETGVIDAPEYRVSYRHGHDEEAYFGLVTIEGDAARVRVVLDGEGDGVFGGGGMGFDVLNGEPPRVRDGFAPMRGFRWAASREEAGGSTRGRAVTRVEFSVANWAPEGWFWRGAGREVGVSIEAHGTDGGVRSMFEPYRPFYARMLERSGTAPMPGEPPEELAAEDADAVLLPGDDRLRSGAGWRLEGGALRHAGGGESPVWVEGLAAGDFDLLAVVEGRQDLILGAFVEGQGRMGALHDYVAFVGGYGNTRTRLRLFGAEAGDSARVVTPGRHTLQLSRRGGRVWALLDGRAVLWAKDPRPGAVVDRLAVLGGYGGEQVVHEVRYRVLETPDARQPRPPEGPVSAGTRDGEGDAL